MTHKRTFLRGFGAALLAPLLGTSARAQGFPSQPVRIIVASAAGGVTDVHARKISDRLAQALGQPVVVDNRPGANGIIATELAAKAKPDGYTLLLAGNAQLAINPAIYAKLPYQPMRDFAPVTGLVRGTPLLLVHPSLPVRSVAELAAYAKARPGKLSYGSSGIGSVQHLATEAFERLAGVHMVHIPYKSGPEMLNDLMAGRLELAVEFQTIALPHVQAGKLRAIAVAGGRARKPQLPDVPTAVELGMPSFDGSGWNGFVVPAGTPPEVIARLQRDIATAVRGQEYLDYVALLGGEIIVDTPAAFGRFLRAELERWTKVAQEANVRVD